MKHSIEYLRRLNVLPNDRRYRTVLSRLYDSHVGSYDSGQVLLKGASCDPRVKLLTTVGKFKVYAVDGEKVRLNDFADFVHGGNHEVYPFIPEGEIWVEHNLGNPAAGLVTLHELVEQAWMKGGMTYGEAHIRALEVERYVRKHPKNLKRLCLMAACGKKFRVKSEKRIIDKQKDATNT